MFGQPVVAAKTAINDLISVDYDQVFVREFVERVVERPSPRAEVAAGVSFDCLGNAISMQWPIGQRNEDVEALLVQTHSLYIYLA